MRRGRHSAVLSPKDRRRLVGYKLRRSRELDVHLGIPQLRLAMGAPFSWETLQRAVQGKRIHVDTHAWILSFLDAQMPRTRLSDEPAELDFKSLAAGERPDDAETANSTRTVRGSR